MACNAIGDEACARPPGREVGPWSCFLKRVNPVIVLSQGRMTPGGNRSEVMDQNCEIDHPKHSVNRQNARVSVGKASTTSC